MRPIGTTKEQIEHLYIQQGKSQAEIAELLNCHQVTVQGWMKRYDIPTRTRAEANRLAIRRNPQRHHSFELGNSYAIQKYSISVELVKTLYIDMGFSSPEIGTILNVPARVVRERLKKASIPIRSPSEQSRGKARPDLIKRNHSSEFQKKVAIGLQRKPNKLEKYLDALLQKHCPGQWQYVGDGEIIISGLSPDFINCNGHKAIIEVFGDYWHSESSPVHQTDYGRKAIFAKYGYKTLIIWEHELKNLSEEEIIQKVKALTQVIE